MIEKILYKVSGDLIENQKILAEIKERAKEKSKLIDLIYGFGTKLSNELKRANIPFEYKDGIRKTTNEGLKIAYKVSEEIKSNLKKEFLGYRNVFFISPIKKVNDKIININGDELVEKLHCKYDKVIVYSLKSRNKDKFRDFKNVEVIYR